MIKPTPIRYNNSGEKSEDHIFSESNTDSNYLSLKFDNKSNFNNIGYDEMLELNFITNFSMRIRILCLNIYDLLKKPLNSSTYIICNKDINSQIFRLDKNSTKNNIYAISKLINLFNETPKRVVIITSTKNKKFIETIFFSEKDPLKYELFSEYHINQKPILIENNVSFRFIPIK